MQDSQQYNEVVKAEIKDQKAYDLYKQLAAHPILNKMSKIIDSKGRTLNLGMTSPNLRKNIVDLPLDEQNKILVFKQKHYEIMCKRNAAHRKAFKTIVNGDEISVIAAIDKLETKKRELIDMFGKMFTCKEAHQIVLDNFKLKGVSLRQIEQFRSMYNPEISTKIEEHKRSFSDIRLGYKRSRLEELSWMYMRRKRIYEVTNKPDDHRLLLQTIEQIRKEAEGDMLKIDANMNLTMESTIQEHIHNELLKYINLKEIIMARVAAKSNIPALKLIESMSHSYYHKVLESSQETRMTDYPSLEIYDFDKINRIQAQKENQQHLIQSETTQISTIEVKAVESIKSIMLKKLAERNGDINLAKNNISLTLMDKTNS